MTRPTLRALALFFPVLLLSACNMPTGYVYHDQLYKAPVQDSSASGAALISQTQAAQIYRAMSDLTTRLTQRAGLAPRPVYVETPAPATQIQTLMDNDLRDTLRRLGYTLTGDPAQGYVIAHRIKPVKIENSPLNAEIALDIFDGRSKKETLLTSETGFYRIDSLDKIIR